MSDKETLQKAIRETINEHEALPNYCPVCGSNVLAMSKHMSKAHPEKWSEWKANHRKVKVSRTVWLEQ